jgi:hypothetical protein
MVTRLVEPITRFRQLSSGRRWTCTDPSPGREAAGLLLRQFGEPDAACLEVQPSDRLVEVLRQHVDTTGYSADFVNSSICASAWLVTELVTTKLQ